MTTIADDPVVEQSVGAPSNPKPSRLKSIMQLELTKGKVKRKELMHFSRQMAVFVRAGIPLLEAIDTITSEMGNKQFREILQDMRARLAAGQNFADAAAAHPESFPDFYVGILRSAELAGTLDDVLIRLSSYIERDLDARRRVLSALTYPAIIAALSVVVVGVLVGFVLPRFETFFDNLNATLPLPTRMLLGMAHWMSTYWYVIVAILGLLVAACLWLSLAERGRRIRDRIVLKVPVLGDVVRHALLERFCRVLSSMINAGVPLPDAMAVTSDATANAVFKEGLTSAREAMLRGEGLAEPLAATGLFPAAARQMFKVGESTGSIDEQLEIAADYFDRELDYKIKRFTALFEPAVILGMGGVVGFVAVALISAMYGIFHQTHIS